MGGAKETLMGNDMKLLFMTLLFFSSLLPSCIHQQSYPYAQPKDSKKNTAVRTLSNKQNFLAKRTHLEKTFLRFAHSGHIITPEDERYIQFLSSKKPRTLIEEATLTLGVSHILARHNKVDEKFTTRSPATNKNATNLTKFSKKYNTDLIYNFQTNFYLPFF